MDKTHIVFILPFYKKGGHIMENKKLIIFIDSGDTLVDEGSEIRDKNDIVIKADLINGAEIMLKTLVEKGYTIALVADGYFQSFKNIFNQHGLYDCFSAIIASECIKAEKPSPRMFKAAVGALDLREEDYKRIVMIGNNLGRDIKGANNLGIKSIFFNWTPRYSKVPKDSSEEPNFIVGDYDELINLIEKLNSSQL